MDTQGELLSLLCNATSALPVGLRPFVLFCLARFADMRYLCRDMNVMTDIRIGSGYDVHRLVEGRCCIVCGVDIPHSRGLLGHSDADVALHALSDALLGAAALGDIGRHFPDTDPQWEGADSRRLLRAVVAKVAAAGYRPGNVDITIVAQEPKMAPHIGRMRLNVAADLAVDVDRVSVKATTTERLGFTGRAEGIAAYASVLLFGRDGSEPDNDTLR